MRVDACLPDVAYGSGDIDDVEILRLCDERAAQEGWPPMAGRIRGEDFINRGFTPAEVLDLLLIESDCGERSPMVSPTDDVIRSERLRCKEIIALCTAAGADSRVRKKLIDDGTPVAAAAEFLARLPPITKPQI